MLYWNGTCVTPHTSTSFRLLPRTVIAAPSYAPISVGSTSSSARLPLRLKSQPETGSSGIPSTLRCIAAGQEYVPLGSYGLLAEIPPPFNASPKRQPTCLRHGSILPDGWVFALTVTDVAPTPCSRTGFHMTSISL